VRLTFCGHDDDAKPWRDLGRLIPLGTDKDAFAAAQRRAPFLQPTPCTVRGSWINSKMGKLANRLASRRLGVDGKSHTRATLHEWC